MSKLEFWVLDVGQGTGNFLQTYDDRGNLVGSVLIDFGSSQAKEWAGFKSLDKVVELLGGEEKDATLDLLLLSHGDVDHIALVPDVLDRYATHDHGDNPKLTIKKMAYGGAYGTYKKQGTGGNVVKRVSTFMPEGHEPIAPPPLYSALRKDRPEPNFRVGDTSYFFVIANAADTTEPPTKKRRTRSNALDGYSINTNSLVVLVEHGNQQFVVTGDATGLTLYQINELLGNKRGHFPAVRMLTLPHHGSATTAFDLHGAKTDPKENLAKFAKNISPSSVTGSAGKRTTYRHPSAQVMSYFWTYVETGRLWTDPLLKNGRHFYTAYFTKGDGFVSGDQAWPKSDGWYSVQSGYGVFTNMYVDPDAGAELATVLPPTKSKRIDVDSAADAPIGVAWKYTVNTKANPPLKLEREINRDDYERLVARAGWVPEEWPDPATLGAARFVTLPSARGGSPGPPPASSAPLPDRTAPTRARPLPRIRELP